MLYILRYRQHPEGVIEKMIEASSDAKAQEVGHAWCGQANNPSIAGQKRLFLSVELAVVADETILANIPSEESPQDAWMLMNAVQRLARTTGKTEDEIRAELRGAKPKPMADSDEPKTGLLQDARQKLRDALKV